MGVIGQISVSEISRKYNLGYQYAQNIVNKLEEIGYIRKKSEYIYELIQTEQVIDNYINLHMEELRPIEYDKFGIKSNGKHTLKSTFKLILSYYAYVIPVFFRRILFSIPECILFLFLMKILSFSTLDGHPPTLLEYIILCIISYIFIGIPSNIVIRIIQSKIYHMKFKDFMILPKNWFFKRCKDAVDICALLLPHKKIIISSYNLAINELEKALIEKKSLAEHYANIANTAKNENEFYQSINSCIHTLEWMSQFEKFGVFPKSNMPSDDIKIIKDNMPLSIERLRKRMTGEYVNPSSIVNYDSMDGHAFEHFCANLLNQLGFSNVEVTPGSGDHGIDILAEKDEIKYAIQCKCYSSNIGNSAVQQAHTGKSIYHRDIAVVLTNQYFTAQAKEEAEALGVKLWDRDKLNEMIEKSSLNK